MRWISTSEKANTPISQRIKITACHVRGVKGVFTVVTVGVCSTNLSGDSTFIISAGAFITSGSDKSNVVWLEISGMLFAVQYPMPVGKERVGGRMSLTSTSSHRQ
jgi:hypothetical protein